MLTEFGARGRALHDNLTVLGAIFQYALKVVVPQQTADRLTSVLGPPDKLD